ncbi:hypothetical protein EB796_007990 [Bugula neritina]|uniref:Secreted protein n=1 Tax=Bugula neritina TaxID=10212 RepID=A0A7J7K705_BUGNE|nr:hypothetical protein EB796_007990 [Bugula neritina]
MDTRLFLLAVLLSCAIVLTNGRARGGSSSSSRKQAALEFQQQQSRSTSSRSSSTRYTSGYKAGVARTLVLRKPLQVPWWSEA